MKHTLSNNPLHSMDEVHDQEQALGLSECLDIVSTDYQTLAHAIPGFKQRSGQEQIIQSCTHAVFNRGVLASQAGTGIGKTFSYLVGCMPFVREQGKHLIVSTHTVALQTQLMEKDLPFVIKQLAPNLKFEVAKGSSRYFCPKRALDLLSTTAIDADNSDKSSENGELFEQDITHQNVNDQGIRLVKQIYQDFEQEKFSGDLDTLTDSTLTPVTAMINRDHQRCPGQKRCPKGDICPFYQQREKVKLADIVVTNHALLSQTITVGTTVLGDLADSIVVLDEAHHFADVMRESNENTISQSDGEQLVKQAKHLGQLSANILKNHPQLSTEIDQSAFTRQVVKLAEQADVCGQSLQELGDSIKVNFSQLRGDVSSNFDDAFTWVLDLDRLHPALQNQITTLFSHYNQLEERISDMLSRFSTSIDRYSGRLKAKQKRVFNEWQTVASKLNMDCQNGQRCLERYVEFDQYIDKTTRAQAGLARWISLDEENSDVVISSNHINIGDKFQQLLVKPCQSLVMTSATLEVMGNYDFFMSRLGFVKGQLGVKTETVFSPFDYSKVAVNAPLTAGDPNHIQHAAEVKKALLHTSNRHKSQLVLFSSYKQMNQTYQLLTQEQQKLVLLQQKLSKSELIRLHKERVDKGNTSILFGVDSLSEGLDLQRQYLTCVLIAKLPFPNINRPILKVEMQCLEALGGNAFFNFSLPMCARKLVQSAGRLIRTEDDYGEIYILDPRINTRRYGKQLLHSLPML